MTKDINVDVQLLSKLSQKPMYGTLGKALWTDPHIAEQMLKYHLNPDVDAASRKKDTIERTSKWLQRHLNLGHGQRILDLGCGPGLYAEEFANMGMGVTGVDFSAGSINYAREQARVKELDIEYICGNYLETDFGSGYDAAVVIYYDLGVLLPWDRDLFLAKVYSALKPGGWLAFDVLAPGHWSGSKLLTWEACLGPGFYRPDSHLVFDARFHYPKEQAWLDQHVIWAEDGPSVIRVWEHYYTPEGITTIVEQAGFIVRDIRADLVGTALSDSVSTLAVLAQRI